MFLQGLRYIYEGLPKDATPSFKTNPLRYFENRQKSQFSYWEKGVLKICTAATIKPRQIERSGFFLLDQMDSSLQTGLGSTRCSVAEKTELLI